MPPITTSEDQHAPARRRAAPRGARPGERARPAAPASGFTRHVDARSRSCSRAAAMMPGHERGHEQLGDVLLGEDRVDDQHAPTAGSGCRACRRRRACRWRARLGSRGGASPGSATWPIVAAVASERAADRAERRAGADRRHRDAAAPVADQRVRGVEQRRATARPASRTGPSAGTAGSPTGRRPRSARTATVLR